MNRRPHPQPLSHGEKGASPVAGARDPVIDVFRLWMAGLVLAAHFLGPFVDFSFYAFGTGGFFVAAGYFCFANPQRDCRNAGFVLLKIIRLYPAYLIAVLGYLLIKPGLAEDGWRMVIHHGLLLVTATLKAEAFYLNPPFWCIPVFVEFFVLFALIRDRYDPVKLFLWTFGLVIVAKALPWQRPEWLSFHLPFYAYAFFLGGVIQQIRRQGRPWPDRLPAPGLAALGCIGATIGLGSLLEWVGEPRLLLFPGWRFYHELCVLLHGATLLCLLYTPRDIWRSRWLMEIARAGFSIYLFHNLVLHEVRLYFSGATGLAVAVLGTLGLALLVQWLVENPVRRWARTWGRRFLTPAR